MLAYCTFSGNYGTIGDNSCGGAHIHQDSVVNCVLWGNHLCTASPPHCTFDERQNAQLLGNTEAASYSCIQGWTAGGTGNMASDPLFLRCLDVGADGYPATADDDFGDLHVAPDSPCIDAGSNFGLPQDAPDVDSDGYHAERFPIDFEGNRRCADDPARPNSGVGYGPIVNMGPFELGAGPLRPTTRARAT